MEDITYRHYACCAVDSESYVTHLLTHDTYTFPSLFRLSVTCATVPLHMPSPAVLE